MEPFVRYIVAGGIAVVAGLWLLAAFDAGMAAWVVGLLLVVAGGASLVYGIAEPLSY